MSLYLKYRPQSFSELKGNKEILASLTSMLERPETCPHSFLLHGPTGCGKTTIARIIASQLGCKGSDLREVDSGQFRGIDTIREIRSNSQFMAIEGTCRVWILDEVHRLTNDAQSALLKILEDTPPHVFFILCTTEPQKLLPTIRGRCSEFQVVTLDGNQMERLLKRVVHGENETLEQEIYEQITTDSLGHPRNALQILEQVLNVPPEQRMEIAKRTAERQSQIIELCRALLDGSKWSKVKKIVEGLKDQDAENIRRVVLGYCQAVLLKSENDRAALIIEEFWEPTYNLGFPYITYVTYSIAKR